MEAMGIKPVEGNCRWCGADFQITFLGTPIVAGECTRCYMDRSRGAGYVTRMAQAATRRAKAHKAAGDRARAKEEASEAKRLVAILKGGLCHG